MILTICSFGVAKSLFLARCLRFQCTPECLGCQSDEMSSTAEEHSSGPPLSSKGGETCSVRTHAQYLTGCRGVGRRGPPALRGLPFPEPNPWLATHLHSTVRTHREVVGYPTRTRPCRVRHPFTPLNQGDCGVPAHSELTRRAAPSWPYQTRKYRPVPRDQGGRRTTPSRCRNKVKSSGMTRRVASMEGRCPDPMRTLEC